MTQTEQNLQTEQSPQTIPAPQTILDFLVQSFRLYHNKTAFIYKVNKQEITISFETFFDDILTLTKAFRKQKIQKGDKVVFISDNRYEWMVTDFALLAIGVVNIPRGTDTPPSELEYIITHSKATHIIFETKAVYLAFEELRQIEKMKNKLIIIGDKDEDKDKPFTLYSSIIKKNKIKDKEREEFIASIEHIHPEDIVSIIYTSGTTGTPKGVILTHKNICNNIRNLPGLIAVTQKDVWLSILPTWHIFERTAEYIAISKGNTLVYSSVSTFASDLEQFRPTIVATVPRVWESMYKKVNAALKKKNPQKAKLFSLLVKTSASWRYQCRVALDWLPRFEPTPLSYSLWQRAQAGCMVLCMLPFYLIARNRLSVVKKYFGGRLRLAISGGGSLPQHIEEWIDAIGIRIVNAYGMTECSPGIAGRGLKCHIFGTIGPAFPGTEIRIVDENNNPLPVGEEGEIQIKGEQVTQGYYDNDEENKKAFTPDGFFRTGDLGKQTITGEYIITGRSKEIIVLANGENVDPSRIEATISMFPFVSDAVLVGQDQKGLGALIVLDKEKWKEYIAEKFSDIVNETENFLENQEIINRIKSEINKLLNAQKGFKPYEKLQNIKFLDKEFKLGEELTNTFKKKRFVIERKYKEIIDRLFR